MRSIYRNDFGEEFMAPGKSQALGDDLVGQFFGLYATGGGARGLGLKGAGKGVSAGENALVRTLQYDIPGHGAQRLVQRGISEKMAQTAISKGSKFFDPKNGTINYILEGGFGSGKDLLIGTNPINGAIKTGIRGTNLVRPRMTPIQ